MGMLLRECFQRALSKNKQKGNEHKKEIYFEKRSCKQNNRRVSIKFKARSSF